VVFTSAAIGMATLSAVHITHEAFWVCMSHALTTEKEEVMGLLLGDIEQEVSHIWAVSVLMRSDKRKDRVEVSPEQSAAAAAEAEKIGDRIGKRTRVVGWYHSHPHITVNPSHVDVRTQAEYQKYMDQGFVGLIFSCFNTDTSKRGRVQVIGFQSFENSSPSSIDIDDDPEHPQIVEGGRYVPKEIPILVVRSTAITSMAPALQKIVSVQQILINEEQQEFDTFTCHQHPNRVGRPMSPSQTSDAGPVHPLAILHAEAVYQKALCRLLENGCAPIAVDMAYRVTVLKEKAAKLKAERDHLYAQLPSQSSSSRYSKNNKKPT